MARPEADPELLLWRARAGEQAARGDLLELYRNYLRLMARSLIDGALRARLDAIGNSILDDLAAAGPRLPLADEPCATALARSRVIVTTDGVDDGIRAKAVGALCLHPGAMP